MPVLTEAQREALEIEYLQLLEQEYREQVSPKMELARDFKGLIIGARGGRAAGAKTSGMISLNVQEANREYHRYACLREIQESLDESLYQAVQEAVDKLQYPGWKFPRSLGYCESPTGSRWIFKGLKDMRATRSTKGLQSIDRMIVDEAANIADDSWDVVLPTLFRNKGARLFFAYNPETESDPVERKIWIPYKDDSDALLLDMRPCGEDNPWWNDTMEKLSSKMKSEDPQLWEHVYGGKPRVQGDYAVINRVDIREAMSRELPIEGDIEEIGIDVARFGDDKTVFVKRHGMKVTAIEVYSKLDTQEVARRGWELSGRNPRMLFKVDDTGVGGGVTDKLKDLGANVLGINFGGEPRDKTKYTSVADEMWFEFPINEVDIPDDADLMEELSGRQYSYTSRDQRKIESKADFKKRLGRSPDKADALLLAFYNPRVQTFAWEFS